jgi:hypothetical protein
MTFLVRIRLNQRIILTATSLLILTACTVEPDSAEAKLLALIEQAEVAAEAGDFGELRQLISQNYSDNAGRDKAALAGILRFYLLHHQSIHLLTRVQTLSLPAPDVAQASLLIAMAGRPMVSAEEAADFRADAFRLEIEFSGENDGHWKVSSVRWRRAKLSDLFNNAS